MNNRDFAAFIMTFERSDILTKTIDSIFRQTFPPAQVLIVDNSTSDLTERLIARLDDARLRYYKVGYNSGPAGAARIGLDLLSKEGYRWIYWGDDDNPPIFPDSFEILLNRVDDSVGVIGAVGSIFNWSTGRQMRYKDSELSGILPVDSIGGGYCMLINTRAITPETLPDEKLFFGWEEFDFCQRVKIAGFKICVLGELLYRYREANNKLGTVKTPMLVPRRNLGQLHREYYSYRNAIYLMAYTYKRYNLVLWYIARATGKIFFGFAKGITFGVKNSKMLARAVVHGLFKRMGKRI
jgi:GT2 family glycosyltransferase